MNFKQISILIFLFIMTFIHFGISQCLPNGISTNPSNPLPDPPPTGRDFEMNTFDWKASSFSLNNTNYTQTSLNSPFWNTPSFPYDRLAFGSSSDFYPADGWELIKRDFGYLMDGNTNSTDIIGPYFILYNKYSGTLRVFIALSSAEIATGLSIHLMYNLKDPNVTGKANLNFSNALCLGNTYAQALDQKATVLELSSPTFMESATTLFDYADFPISYDPCTCLYASSLDVSFLRVETAHINLDGRLAAVSTTYMNDAGLQTKSYLAAVFKQNGTDVIAGVQTQKLLDSLIGDYNAALKKQQLDQSISALFGIVGTVLSVSSTYLAGTSLIVDAGTTSVSLVCGTQTSCKH